MDPKLRNDPRMLRARDVPDHFLDIADDGYTITGESSASPKEVTEVQANILKGSWAFCNATSALGECEDRTCGCSRDKNPTARTFFIKSVVQCLKDVCKDREGDVVLASLGCGKLRFDFEFMEFALAAGIPVSAVHLVDPLYCDPKDATDEKQRNSIGWHRYALSQYCSWFADRVEVYAHTSVDEFAIRARKAGVLPVVALQVDCAPLTEQFDDLVKPQLEEVLQYGGIFCALSPRGAARTDEKPGSMDAYGEVWRLVPESGRLRLASKTKYAIGEQPKVLGDEEDLPPAASH